MFIIQIKSITTKAHPRHKFGDCATSGIFSFSQFSFTGCFKSQYDQCTPNNCTSLGPSKKLPQKLYGAKYGKFCCCFGDLCNMNVSDGYDPTEAMTTQDVGRSRICLYAKRKERVSVHNPHVICPLPDYLLLEVHWEMTRQILARFNKEI